MADETAEAKTTFFDTSAALLLKTDCKTMINQLGYIDPHMLPIPLTNVLGKTKIFQIRFGMSSKPGAIDFVVDHVFEDKVILQEESEAEVQNVQQHPHPGTSTTLVPTFVASVPAPPALKTPAPTTPTPLVPSVSSYQKRPRQSSAKKALFQTSGCQYKYVYVFVCVHVS